MRFFSGTRSSGGGGDKKKTSASEIFMQKASGKTPREKTPEEKYADVIENKLHKMMEDAIMGRKKASLRLNGTKKGDDSPKQLTKSAITMLRLLAEQKAKLDHKKEKKAARAEMWAKAAKKREATMKKTALEAQIEAEKKAAEEAAAAAIAAAHAAQAAAEESEKNNNSSWW